MYKISNRLEANCDLCLFSYSDRSVLILLKHVFSGLNDVFNILHAVIKYWNL